MRRHPVALSPSTIKAVVAAYITEHRDDTEKDLGYFANLPTFAQAVRSASLAEGLGRRRMPHQRRIPRLVLEESARRLQGRIRQLGRARTFETLHAIVSKTIDDIHGIGELTVYDTALRIARFQQLEPVRVYLHAGTREGARALGVPRTRAWVSPVELPRAFGRLLPRQIEDCLCIYKAELRGLSGSEGRIRTKKRRRGC